jgi:hypothetical protein
MARQTKQQLIASMVDKEQSKFDKRIQELKLRLEAEEIKNKPIDGDDVDVIHCEMVIKELIASKGINGLKLIDFLAKEIIGKEARVLYRKPRVIKANIPVFGKKGSK